MYPNEPTLSLVTSSPSNQKKPSFNLGDLEVGSSIGVYSDESCDTLIQEEEITAATMQIQFSEELSNDGFYAFYAKQKDKAENSSYCTSDEVSYVLDTIAAIPTLSLVTSSPSNNFTPIFSLGNLEIGGTLSLYSNENCSMTALEMINITEGNMDVELSSSLTNTGNLSFSAKQADGIGNSSLCSMSVDYILSNNCGEQIFSSSDSSEIVSSTSTPLSCSIAFSNNNTPTSGTCQSFPVGACFFEKESGNYERVCVGEARGSCQYSCNNSTWTKTSNDCAQVQTRESATPYIRKISLGAQHSCALLSVETVKCWGAASQGEIGNGTNPSKTSTPIDVSNLNNIRQISTGNGHSCAILNDDINTPDTDETGTVKCWGANFVKQIGNSSTLYRALTPVEVSTLTNIRQLSARTHHTCALLNDDVNTTNINESGTVKCWGYNYKGLFLATGSDNDEDSSTPLEISGATNVHQIATGSFHTCLLLGNDGINDVGKVKCWGYNKYGQLGDGSLTNRYQPVIVSGLSNVRQIVSGKDHTCAILNDDTNTTDINEAGTVKCWGNNESGQLGNGSTTNSSLAVTVSGISNARQIALGEDHTCAILNDDTNTTDINEADTLKCWGNNEFGQLGNNSTDSSSSPVDVSNLSNVREISLGEDHTCAILNDSTVECWGSNAKYQLGVSSAPDTCSSNNCSLIPISNSAFPAESLQ